MCHAEFQELPDARSRHGSVFPADYLFCKHHLTYVDASLRRLRAIRLRSIPGVAARSATRGVASTGTGIAHRCERHHERRASVSNSKSSAGGQLPVRRLLSSGVYGNVPVSEYGSGIAEAHLSQLVFRTSLQTLSTRICSNTWYPTEAFIFCELLRRMPVVR